MYQEVKLCQYPNSLMASEDNSKVRSCNLQSQYHLKTSCNADSQAPLQAYWDRICIFQDPQMICLHFEAQEPWVPWVSSQVLNGTHHHQHTLLVSPVRAAVHTPHCKVTQPHRSCRWQHRCCLRDSRQLRWQVREDGGEEASVTDHNFSVYLWWLWAVSLISLFRKPSSNSSSSTDPSKHLASVICCQGTSMWRPYPLQLTTQTARIRMTLQPWAAFLSFFQGKPSSLCAPRWQACCSPSVLCTRVTSQ